MIDKQFWKNVAENWVKDDDGIIIPDDREQESAKATEIKDEDLLLFNDISNDEINDILSDLGLDDL